MGIAGKTEPEMVSFKLNPQVPSLISYAPARFVGIWSTPMPTSGGGENFLDGAIRFWRPGEGTGPSVLLWNTTSYDDQRSQSVAEVWQESLIIPREALCEVRWIFGGFGWVMMLQLGVWPAKATAAKGSFPSSSNRTLQVGTGG